MKRIFLITILSLISVFGFSQVTNNFESGNWNYYANHCWGISPNSSYFETKVTNNSNAFGNPKSSVCETANLGQKERAILESPWIDLVPGSITFKHVIKNFNGDIDLKLYIVDESNNANLLYTYNYSNGGVDYASVTNNTTGVHKMGVEQ